MRCGRRSSAAAAEGVELREGDVVLVRTGSGAHWDDRPRYEAGPGVAPDGSRWLAGRRPVAVGADNLAWDVPGIDDPELGTLPGHTSSSCARASSSSSR